MSTPSILDKFIPSFVPLREPEIKGATVGVNKVVMSVRQPIPIKPRGTGKRGPYILYGKRWYFRLVKSDETYRARALMDDYTVNDISRHLVICYAPDKLPGNHGRYNKQIRIYAYFDSYLEFHSYMRNFSQSKLCFYEVIFGELPQKPHFDIDIDISEFNKLYPGEDVEAAAVTLRDNVISSSIELLGNINITRDILIYSSHGPDKKSFHVIINNKCHDGNKEAKAFYSKVLANIPKYGNFIDSGVYSPRQQFRIMRSQKGGSNRPKIFEESFTYKGITYTHEYPEDVSNPEIKLLTQLYESLASFTSGCVYIPSFLPPKSNDHTDLSALSDLTQSSVDHCIELMEEKFDTSPFSVKEVRGHLILLKRNQPSYCPVCKRIHRAEHPFIYIIYGKAYFDCRRSMDHANGEKTFLGYISLDNKELSTDSPQEDDELEGIFDFGGFKMTEPVQSTATNPPKDPVLALEPPPPEERLQNLPELLRQETIERERNKNNTVSFKTLINVSPPTEVNVPRNRKIQSSMFSGAASQAKF